MKKSVIILGILISAVMLIFSCDDNSDASAAAEGNNANFDFIRYSFPSYQKYDEIRERFSEIFNERYDDEGVQSRATPVSGQNYFDKIQLEINSKQDPDVYFMRDQLLPIYVKNGWVQDLTDYYRNDPMFRENPIYQSVLDAYTINGRLYGIPGSFTTIVIYYNKQIFDEWGIPYPKESMTWDEMAELAQQLTLRNESGFVERFGISFEFVDWITMFMQNGARIFSPDQRQCVIASEASIEAANKIKYWVNDLHIMPDSRDLQGAEPHKIFMEGRSAMFVGGRWYSVEFSDDIKDFEWSVAPLYHNREYATRLDSMCWVMSANSQHKDYAWEMIKIICGPIGQGDMVRVKDSLPLYKTYPKDGEFYENPDNTVYFDSIQNSYATSSIIPRSLSYSAFIRILNTQMQDFMADKKTAREALETAERLINQEIAQSIN